MRAESSSKRRRVRRDVDAEALAEPAIHASSSGTGGIDGAAQALQAALEVDVRAVALEVARPGGRGRPSRAASASNMRERDHALGLARRARARRVGGGLVARDDEQADGSGSLALLVAGRGPGVADAAPVRRAREVERAAAASPSRAARGCQRAPSRRPDQISRRRPRSACRAGAGTRARASAQLRPSSSSRSVHDLGAVPRAALSQRSTIGARSTTGSSPSTTTTLRVADRRERQAEGVERVARLLGQHRRVRAEARAQELPSAYACSTSRSRRARSRLRAAVPQQLLRLVERVVPARSARRLRADARAAAR